MPAVVQPSPWATDVDADQPPSSEPVDGRRARRQRNRNAVVDAMLSLFAEGNLDPSSEQIAERSGVSPRSLFRYFGDLDDLVRTAIARQYQRLLPAAALDLSTTADLPDRVHRLVDQRLRLFDAIGMVGVVSRVRAPFQPLIARELAASRSLLRHQLEQLFAPELAALGHADSSAAIAAIDVLTSFEAMQLMASDQHLGPAQIHATLCRAVNRVLEG
jgi:AcrR family transcriptional regulator